MHDFKFLIIYNCLNSYLKLIFVHNILININKFPNLHHTSTVCNFQHSFNLLFRLTLQIDCKFFITLNS